MENVAIVSNRPAPVPAARKLPLKQERGSDESRKAIMKGKSKKNSSSGSSCTGKGALSKRVESKRSVRTLYGPVAALSMR
jgi:hypothetical protein